MTARDMLLLITFAGFAVMVVALLLSTATSRRKKVVELDHRRLDLLERALQHPSLDEATRAELLQVLANPRGQAHEPSARPPRKLGDWWHLIWYGSAWILFVVGGCMLAAHALSLTPGLDVRTFLPMTITGFAMLTLPLALRELRVRGQHPSTADR